MFLLKYNGTEKICFHIHPTPIYKMPTYNFAEGEFFYDAWLGPFQTLQSQMWSNRNQMNCQCYYRKIQIGRLKKKPLDSMKIRIFMYVGGILKK